jgi:hypothetical protein
MSALSIRVCSQTALSIICIEVDVEGPKFFIRCIQSTMIDVEKMLKGRFFLRFEKSLKRCSDGISR